MFSWQKEETSEGNVPPSVKVTLSAYGSGNRLEERLTIPLQQNTALGIQRGGILSAHPQSQIWQGISAKVID